MDKVEITSEQARATQEAAHAAAREAEAAERVAAAKAREAKALQKIADAATRVETKRMKDGFALIAREAVRAIRNDPVMVKAIREATGIKKQAITQWRERVPLERVLAVSRATGIAPHLIRPDHYPPPDAAGSEVA